MEQAERTQTTGDQKTTRQWLNKYGQYNLHRCVLALLKYLASNCYWQQTGKSYKIRRDFEVSQTTLAKNMYCSPRSVQKYVDEAQRLGFITVIKRADSKRDAYALHIDQAENFAEYTPSKAVKSKQDRLRREYQVAWNRKRREQLAQQAAQGNLCRAEEYAEGAGI